MTKRWAVFLALFLLPFAAPAAPKGGGYTLIVAPARYSVMQVVFDLIDKHSSVLVSYQGEATTAEPLMHVWSKGEWVRISLADFREVNFLEKTPTRTVLIGDAQTLPASIVEASAWSPEVVRIEGLDTASLVNEFGKLFDFKDEEWEWFSARYNLELHDQNVALRNASWYDQPGPLKKGRPKMIPKEIYHEPKAPKQEGVTPVEPVQPAQAAPPIAPESEPPPAPVTDSSLPDADRQAVE